MHALLAEPLSPVYAIAVVGFIALLSWPLSYALAFYRRELKVEDLTRLTPLDGLRGVLCFAVMAHHAAVTRGYVVEGRGWTRPENHFYNLAGAGAVALFFSVTSFLFWTRGLARHGKVQPLPFLRARAFRVGPMYVVSCLTVLAILAPQIDWRARATAGRVALIALLGIVPWTGFGPADARTVNATVTWSLRFEWGFYLALPALAALGRVGALPLCLLAMGGGLTFGPGPAAFFVPGVVAAYAARAPRVAQRLRHPTVGVAVVLTAAAWPLITGDGMALISLVPVTIVFVPIACGNSVFGVLNLRGLRLMGMVSYSVYLMHAIGLYLARPALRAAGGYAGPWHYWAEVAAVAGGVLVVSMLSYRWVEWPFIRAEKRIRRTPQTEDLVKRRIEATADEAEVSS